VEADQQWISRERRKTLVGGIAVAGGTKRQHLPDALAAVMQKIGEGIRFGAKLSNAGTSWKGSGMQQNSTGSRKVHVRVPV
jgi:hypothetical protein